MDKWNKSALQLTYGDKSQRAKHFPVAILLVAAGAQTEKYMVNELLLAATELGDVAAVQNLVKLRPDPLYQTRKDARHSILPKQ